MKIDTFCDFLPMVKFWLPKIHPVYTLCILPFAYVVVLTEMGKIEQFGDFENLNQTHKKTVTLKIRITLNEKKILNKKQIK